MVEAQALVGGAARGVRGVRGEAQARGALVQPHGADHLADRRATYKVGHE